MWALVSRLSLTLVLLFFVSVLCVSSSKGASVTLSCATSESATPLLDGTALPTHHGRAAASPVSSDGEIKPIQLKLKLLRLFL